ncbi:MAG: glucose/arabinose dehydrogenase [Verrucomicrobiales bacterium]|jgi:glucose/arabinose dehydrogenase
MTRYLFAVCLFSIAHAQEPEHQIRWAAEPITIDGKADEKIWETAQVIDKFQLGWLAEPRDALTKTKARLLWDRDFVYFFAEMEDTDLYADETKHDGNLWENDVFELFFKPSPKHPGYYEFQVNPTGAILDVFYPRLNAGGLKRFIDDFEFHVEAAVQLNGTLNHWEDTDEGWSCEGRIPWTDFVKTGGPPAPDEIWKFTLCRYDYSVDLEGGKDSSSVAPLSRYNFHWWEDYLPVKFIGPPDDQAQLPEALKSFGAADTTRMAGSPEPPPPFTVEPAFPDLEEIRDLITFAFEPGTGRIFYTDRLPGKQESRLRRFDPKTGKTETLFENLYTFYDLEFHPDFAKNGYLFVGNNGPSDLPRPERHSRVTRYKFDFETQQLLADSEKTIIEWLSGGHDGSAVAFGAEGLLFVTSGDGSNDSDTNIQGQGLDHLRAKVLRIDVDHGDPYAVPKDNPFVDLSGARPETWAYGFRNPWRMSYDAKSDQLWVGNNGQDLLEQVYLVERGANYGWSVYEGSRIFYENRKLGPTPVSKPTFEHDHGESRSLTGGLVYNGDRWPDLDGAYLYGDNSTGKIWAGKHDGEKVTWHEEIADTNLSISDFGVDADGEILIADLQRGAAFYRLVRNEAKDKSAEFPRKLSQTGLFKSVSAHEVESALLPYSVAVPQWADGATADRFLALPEVKERMLSLSPYNGWKLPEGTTAIQTFGFGEGENRRLVETRILTQQEKEWFAYSYRWNEAQTEATLVDADGADAEIKIGDRLHSWRFASRAECMFCHSRASGFVLGLQTPQFNTTHDYGDGAREQLLVLEALGLSRSNWKTDALQGEQLALSWDKREARDRNDVETQDRLDLAHQRRFGTRNQRGGPSNPGMLSMSPASYPRLARPDDQTQPVALRARSYLHANCAHCHREAGGGNSRINLQFFLDERFMNLFESPNHGTLGLTPAEDFRVVKPGDPSRSTLFHRVANRGEGSGQMPPIGAHTPDPAAATVILQWIAEMKEP